MRSTGVRKKDWPFAKGALHAWLGDSLPQVSIQPSGSQLASLHCPLRVATILLQDVPFALGVNAYTLMSERCLGEIPF